MSSQISNTVCDKYNCIICLDWAKRPISCNRCHKLICQHHVWLLNNRCPNCRLQPFQFQNERLIQSFIEVEVYRRREKMKKENVFKCLVQGCNFSGKYQAMEFHRRSRHFQEKIDQILFPEERQKKNRRDALKKLFIDKFAENQKKHHQKALIVYVKTRGIYEIKQIVKMVAHIEKCSDPCCKEILFNEKSLFIGVKDSNQVPISSTCQEAVQFKQFVVDF